jgi:hypothetical protein
MSDKEQESGCERLVIFYSKKIYSQFYFIRVVEIDGQRRQISIRRPTSEVSQRNTGEDTHNFFFDAVYDWKYVNHFRSTLYLLI